MILTYHMSIIFISHSKRDEELVLAMQKVLVNVGHTPILEEFISEDEQEKVPYAEIKKNVNLSEYVFLFLTDNVIKTEYTRNWVSFEVGLTAQANKSLFVFERDGIPLPYPIPYLTDFMIFDENSTNAILDIQTMAKKLNEVPRGLAGAGAGALVGALAGPLGLVVGGLLGGIVGAGMEEQIPKVKCPSCNIEFKYYSDYKQFKCPACREWITLN